MLSYSLLYYYVFGQEIEQFNNYFRSLITFQNIFMFRNDEAFFETTKVDYMITAIMTICEFVTIKYGVLVLLNAVIQESYRKSSYTESHITEVKEFYA